MPSLSNMYFTRGLAPSPNNLKRGSPSIFKMDGLLSKDILTYVKLSGSFLS